MRKIYEYKNKAEAELIVSTKSAKFKYRFTGGIMDPKNKVHARYMTDNIVMQKVLENSEYFNKVIFIVDTFDSPVPMAAPLVRKAKAVEAPKVEDTEAEAPKAKSKSKAKAKPVEEKPEEKAVEMAVVEDVTDMGAAASYLISEGYANAEDLMTPEGVLKAAKEMNISFPNLK